MPQETGASFTLRPAKRVERCRINKLVWQARLNPTGLDWRRFVVAAHPKGDVVACAQIKPHRDGSRELASLVVAPGYRGRGVARLVIEHLIQNHEGNLYLICRASLGDFYNKFGFKAIAVQEMPPYFRWIAKMASVVNSFRKEGGALLVMRR